MSDEWLKGEAKLQVVSKGVVIHESCIDPAHGRDATVVVIPAADFHDTRPADVRAAANVPWGIPFSQVHSRLEQQSRELREFVDRVCGMFGMKAERKHVSDAAWKRMRARFGLSIRDTVEAAHRNASVVVLSVEEHDRLLAAHEANGQYADTASKANADRYHAQGQIEHLDRENARLRRELAYAQERLRGITFHTNDAGELIRIDERDRDGNVRRVMWEKRAPDRGHTIRVEPFPEVEPRDESWPPPSHKPRMLP
jgi:hypothetical protein